MQKEPQQLSLMSLVAIMVSAAVGSGVFNLMKEMALETSVIVAGLAWVIAGLGMGALAVTFSNLNESFPNIEGGVFGYAVSGLGDLGGFMSTWMYWLAVLFSSIAQVSLLFNALAYFFPTFGDGQNLYSVIGASIFLWSLHFLVSRGTESAAVFNTIVLIAKFVPIFVFIIIAIIAFNGDIFIESVRRLTATGPIQWGSVFHELKASMLVTVWAFVGMEGVTVFSSRAKRRSDVGKGTVYGFGAVTLLYLIVTLVSYGVMTQEQLAALPNPAMGYILEAVIGPWGAWIINLGVIISLVGSGISWAMIGAETGFQASELNMFPKLFSRLNDKKAPATASFIRTMIAQIVVLLLLVATQAYSLISRLSGATVVVPYSLATVFLLLNSRKAGLSFSKQLPAWIAFIYLGWIFYASGYLFYLLLMLSLGLGAVCFVVSQRYYNRTLNNKALWIVWLVLVIGFIFALYRLPVIMELI